MTVPCAEHKAYQTACRPCRVATLDDTDARFAVALRAVRKLRVLRLHYKNGQVVTEPLTRLASRHGDTLNGARLRVVRWVVAGDLRARGDGGYDVIRFRQS